MFLSWGGDALEESLGANVPLSPSNPEHVEDKMIRSFRGFVTQSQYSSVLFVVTQRSSSFGGRHKHDRSSLTLPSLKSDQRQITPCNITALPNRVVMRVKDMITQDESKFSPLLLLKTYRDNK